MHKNFKIIISVILSVIMLCSVVVLGTTTASADTATGVGLSGYCLKAYNEQWDYVWGGITPGSVDCTGLVYSYHGVGGIRTDMLSSSSDWGYVSNGIPRIHGLGLHQPGHVGVYVGSGLEVDARSTYDDMCYGSVWDLSWCEWFKIYGVSYPTSGWVKFNGNSFYYEGGQYIVNTSRTIDGVTYDFDSNGYSDTAPNESAYEQTDYSTNGSSGGSSSSDSSSSFLKVGSSGDRVTELQNKLKKLGYFNDGVTGYFGSYTKGCLIAFQKDAGIEVDGIAGPEVFTALDSDDAPSKKPSNTDEEKTEPTTVAPKTEETTAKPTTEATEPTTAKSTTKATESTEPTETTTKAPVATEAPTEATTADDGVLRLGDTDPEVKILQERLFVLRYLTADITGEFDNNTLDAIHAYLAASELSSVDEVSPDLYELILSDKAVVSPDYNNLKLNYVGSDVEKLESKLIETGYLNTSAPTKTFDKETETAVKLAQTNFALEVTGVADDEFKAALDLESERKAGITNNGDTTKTSTISKSTKIGTKALDTVTNDITPITTVVATSDTNSLYQILIWVAAAMLAVSLSATCYFIIDKKRKKTSKTTIK